MLDASLIARVRASLDLPAGERVVVAMSGGVDSSVTAALVNLAGYDAIGITLQLYDHGEAVRRKGACCAGQDIHDARRVASALGIPHYVLDFEDRFRRAVIDEFVASYRAGLTPVPCITCNRTVKFNDLLVRSKALGAAAMATGHYVESRRGADGRRALFTPVDMDRDQSYFLFATTQEQIDYLRFPLGGLAKAETRRIAGELGLMVADKPDSQDICFVPEGRYTDVVAKLAPDAMEPGDIVNEDGHVLGRHSGIANFTVGQRKGIGIGGGDALHVLGVDAPSRQVRVGPREKLLRHDFTLSDVNWLGGEGESFSAYVKIRSARAPTPATLSMLPSAVRVTLRDGEYGIAPGQACVFYERSGPGARVLGGGIIDRPVAGDTSGLRREAVLAR
jgi:tRNA-specific 2-thiouridylase